MRPMTKLALSASLSVLWTLLVTPAVLAQDSAAVAVRAAVQTQDAVYYPKRGDDWERGRAEDVGMDHARTEYLFTVGRGNFVPSPRVDSAVIKLDLNSPLQSKAADYTVFDYLVRRLFDERRKQVQKVLRKGSRFSIDADDIDRIAELSGVTLTRRPEELPVEDFVRLADVLAAWESTA